MIIKPNTPEVVYITIHDTTFYIDYSLAEPIVEMWKTSEEIVTLTPDFESADYSCLSCLKTITKKSK